YLREQYVIEADDLIGIQLERSLDMIVSILGVLKSGGAYVPIDTEYPEDRISYILEDSNCTALLDTDKMSVFKAVAGNYKKENPQVLTSSNNLAYVIYTSGTTGSPKGVMIEHRNVVNLLSTQTKFYNIESDDNFLLFSSISFDASVEQLYLPLVNGAKLYVITTEKILNTSVFEAFLLENKIAHFQAVPSFFRTLSSRSLLGLKRIVSGGDIFDKNTFRELDRKISVINKYGPTEATVTSTGYLVRDFDVNSLSIGKPIGNTSIYILDSALHLCAKGVVGELCIGGDGLARGYLNRAELTCEKFVPNPFVEGDRIYRTGDLARWLPDGNIEFIGRNDDQVKIRGYRIELGEIEKAMDRIAMIDRSVVLLKEDGLGEKVLVGYIVCNG